MSGSDEMLESPAHPNIPGSCQINLGRVSRGERKKKGGIGLVQESHATIKTDPRALSPMAPVLRLPPEP